MKGVAVTGMGMISAIGSDLNTTICSLKNGKDGLSLPEILDTRHANLPVGEIKMSNTELGNKLGLSTDHDYTRASLLGVHALKELLKNVGYDEFPAGTGFISGTSVGGIDKTEEHFSEFTQNILTRKYIQAQHPGYTTGRIAEYFGLNGHVTTISTACSSSANAIMIGAQLIASGKLKRVIVGGSDCLTRFTLNGFNALKILSPEKCKAFDNARNGLNLGEAAAYLLLEADDCTAEGKVIGRLCGYANSNDAFHQTASSENGEGAYLAIRKALQQANLAATEIDYINAHGTGTRNNDFSESIAMTRFFKNNLPPFCSTKGFTGHTLGAAGAVEAIISLLSLQHQEIYPNLNFDSQILETGLTPVSSLQKKDLRTILSNSFGFGGNCTSLIFQSNA